MVAESTLFLSSDGKLQVRAHTTLSGQVVFCVKDFIRQISETELGPEDSMIYWLHAVGKLANEDKMLDQVLVLFAGPYEMQEVCIDAEGLLILFHLLDNKMGMVTPCYRIEIQEVLTGITSRGYTSNEIRMHDDGEIDELLSEKGDQPLVMPPLGSKYLFVTNITNDKEDKELPVEGAYEALCSELELAKANGRQLLDELNQKTDELARARASLLELKAVQHQNSRKCKRREGFCVRQLITENRLDVPEAYMDALCKAVIFGFRLCNQSQEHGMFVRHRVVYFYPEQREVVTAILQDEFLKLKLRLIEDEQQDSIIRTGSV